ncbi:hypothetical protein EPUS_00701 [Endocarpon pusillum Z07020]|uniref:Putative gamma-glutamylcyclotransferase n=1 Tax=Endocarpon pusillum (strain Z07020 / HMAS-L-300199) TaxID=1263415 RepID=U1GRG0_ENDPU|nr:uncharacterized protein EPUS_00701 [Endocarpon pusillum Z07020]ERF74571.1 hypothetical protein EPUS_00701 [Endocarpon pusillum Z07020]
MEFLAELEYMATNVVDELNAESEHDIQSIARWQRLFAYTHAEAAAHIMDYRGNLSRTRVSDEHWDIVRAEKVAEGYDREAYEYSIGLRKFKRLFTTITADSQKPSTYLVKLEGSLASAAEIQRATGMTSAPTLIRGIGDAGDEANFVRVDGTAKKAILDSLAGTTFQPTFIRISKAEKALSDSSMHPILGIDSTLPQHRLDHSGPPLTYSPAQDQYPVWYFVYGSLADPDVLSRLLSLSETPDLRPASISGGVLRTWAGKYKALVDAPNSEDASVYGCAYRVVSREHEEGLLYYETERYEVVRCLIEMRNETKEIFMGLTFRFANHSQDLL